MEGVSDEITAYTMNRCVVVNHQRTQYVYILYELDIRISMAVSMRAK